MLGADIYFIKDHVIPFQNGINARFKFKIRKSAGIARIYVCSVLAVGGNGDAVCRHRSIICWCRDRCTRYLIGSRTCTHNLLLTGCAHVFGIALLAILAIAYLIGIGPRGRLIIRRHPLIRGKGRKW